jgi:hypothetical protein
MVDSTVRTLRIISLFLSVSLFDREREKEVVQDVHAAY